MTTGREDGIKSEKVLLVEASLKCHLDFPVYEVFVLLGHHIEFGVIF